MWIQLRKSQNLHQQPARAVHQHLLPLRRLLLPHQPLLPRHPVLAPLPQSQTRLFLLWTLCGR